MFKEGIGESGLFASAHPIVTASYYTVVIGLLMFSNSPPILASAILAGLLYDMLLKGVKSLRNNIVIVLFMTILSMAINVMFTHNGSTVLFYLGNNRFTLEAAVYGFAMALMISSVIVWFASFNVVMTSEKLIYLFGRFAPVLGLTLSMIFRFVPLLKTRFAMIRNGQKALGASDAQGFLVKIKRFTKEVSILISWSLEASIESADSMAARGYGLKGRSSYSLFKFKNSDFLMLVLIVVLGSINGAAYAMGFGRLYYYPVIRAIVKSSSAFGLLGYISFLCLLIMPLAMDLVGELKWKKSKSTI